MALLNLDFESEYMGSNQNVNIILPDKPRLVSCSDFYGSGRKYKVLWLLHGTFGGYSDWIRKSNIELYACEKDLIVVMPGVGNSDYESWNNFTFGLDADRYITEELMPLVYGWLPASPKREDNFVAGLSMGGAGALKFALKYPDKFSKCASLSYCPSRPDEKKLAALFAKKRADVIDPEDVMKTQLRVYNQIHRYDSLEEYLASDSNLYGLLMKSLDRTDLPEFFFASGTEDPLMTKPYMELKKTLKKKGFPAEWHEGPGSHEWRVWERDIQKAFAFFGLKEEGKGNEF